MDVDNTHAFYSLFADALLYFIPHRADVWEEMIEDIQDPKNLYVHTQLGQKGDHHLTFIHTHTAHTLTLFISPFLVVFVTFLNTVLAGCPLDLRVDLRQELLDNGFTTELLESALMLWCY